MDLAKVLAEIPRKILFSILLMLFGAFIGVLGLVSRDEQPRQVEKTTDEQAEPIQVKSKPSQDDDQARIEFGPIKFPRPFLPRQLRFALMIIGGVLLVIGLFQFRVDDEQSPTLTASPSLISLSYMVEGWDPRMVDLRTASSSGIPVRAGQALQLLDVWVWVPQDAPEYKVQAEVYAKDQFIGSTASQPLLAGTIQLGDVTVKDFHHGDYADAWRVQEGWTDLTIALVTSRGDKVMGSTRTMIHLDPSGTAWLFDPPNLSFVSIVYTVNGGPPLVLDFRDASEAGLDAGPGDTLTILEIWYHSNANGDTAYGEGFLNVGGLGFDQETYQTTGQNVIKEGIHRLDDFTMSWTIPDDKDFLVLKLVRNDATIMQELKFPLGSPGSLGLVRSSASILDYDHSKFLNFESDSDLADWSGEVSRSSVYSFTGSYSLQASFAVTESTPFLRFATWDREFTSDAILAHYYLPETPNVEVELIQFCIPIGDWVCWSVDRTQGTWHTIMLDLSKMRHTGTDKTLNQVSLPGLLVHGVIRSSTTTEPIPYSIYLDALHILEDES